MEPGGPNPAKPRPETADNGQRNGTAALESPRSRAEANPVDAPPSRAVQCQQTQTARPGRHRRGSRRHRGGVTIRKALQTVVLLLLCAVLALAAVFGLFSRNRRADGDPNLILARAVLPFLKDGQTFRLADAYPEPWDAAQVVQSGEALTDWAWRTLRAFDSHLAQVDGDAQLLVFWREGNVARIVRFERAAGGMPWFAPSDAADGNGILSREDAVFRATLMEDRGVRYYLCVREAGAVQV